MDLMNKNTPKTTPSLLFLSAFVGLLLLSFIWQRPYEAVGKETLGTSPTVPTAEAVLNLPLILQQVVTPTVPPSCVPPTFPPHSEGQEAATLTGLNSQRNRNGVASLNKVNLLVQSSRRHSVDMALNNFTDHVGSDGSTFTQRIADACYNASFVNEIIGWGFGGDTSVMIDWWMNSPIHRAAILDGTLVDAGAGYVYDPSSEWVTYWTVNFGKPYSGKAGATAGYICQYSAESPEGGSSITFMSERPCP